MSQGKRNADAEDFDIVSESSASVSNIFKVSLEELKAMFDKKASEER